MSVIRIVEFKTKFKGDKGTDWVLIAPPGEAYLSTQTWHPVERLRPRDDMSDDEKQIPTNMAMLGRWSVIGPAYEAWKKGMEIPETGTPLAAWSGATVEEQEVLRKMGIKTIEAVAEMSDSAIAKMPFPNARKLPKLAADYLAGKGAADLQAELAEMRERNEAMQAMLEEMAQKKPAKKAKEAA